MQGGFKVVPYLFEGLVREDRRKKKKRKATSSGAIRSRGLGERERVWLAKKTVVKGKDFVRIKQTIGKFTVT